MKRGTPSHPKVFTLAELLEIELPHAVGLLEMLWHYTAQYASDGGIGRWRDSSIAAALFWRGDPQKLVSSLLEAKLLDSSGTCRLMVHDWPEHAEESVHKRLAREGKRFADGTIPNMTSFDKSERQELMKAYEATGAQMPPQAPPGAQMPPQAPPGPLPLPLPKPLPQETPGGGVYITSARATPRDPDPDPEKAPHPQEFSGGDVSSPEPSQEPSPLDVPRAAAHPSGWEAFCLEMGIGVRDWAPACEASDLVERSGGPAKGAGKRRRAVAFAMLVAKWRESPGKEHILDPWLVVLPTLREATAKAEDERCRRVLAQLRDFEDGAYPGMGRDAPKSSAEEFSRVEELARHLGFLTGSMRRREATPKAKGARVGVG